MSSANPASRPKLRRPPSTVVSSSKPQIPLVRSITRFHPISCLSTANTKTSPARRTANFQPTIWDDNYIQSLPVHFMEEKYKHQRDKLKEEVRCLIGQQHGLVKQLELVDALRQLGIDYHFDSEIMNLLSCISSSTENIHNLIKNNNLYGSALLFRLLREHGINNAAILRVDTLISCFKKVRESFNPNHQYDVKEMLSLYEASYLAMEGEEELDEAGKFAMEHLRRLDRSLLSPQLIEEIDHALELPLHWRMPRLHSRWFIDAYGKQENVNPILLELAKLDFNIVQSIYMTELKEISNWWRNLGVLCDELDFIRDRLVENHLWALGFTFQPKFWRSRKAITKINCLVTTIDDVYDVYGTLDELEIFTNAVEDWKMDAAQQLPNCMKICLMALFNTMNEVAYSFLKEKELDILPCLKRVWVDLCKAYLIEARWYHNRYTPTLDEYLENAWVTISGNCGLSASYCLSDDLNVEALDSIKFYPPIVQHSCMIFRLYNDLGTDMAEIQRGDVLKSIQCYMNEKNVSDSAARDYIRCLIRNYWKKLNGEYITFSTSIESFRKALVDVPRTAQSFYHYGDGYGEPGGKTKDQIFLMMIEPIPL
ncbi:alpha-terpineol synthase, chloroplastic-like [Dendrobium catenatum]|uniref:alpha-terpineol synthase, chloroplastic-like n=1 Tax=Dendrobium catenatum TaxID=906689 RepID=UPI00109FF818|nr:alpha-terpineol synthase, chloroplastic-like [Dendrobium catenatum]